MKDDFYSRQNRLTEIELLQRSNKRKTELAEKSNSKQKEEIHSLWEKIRDLEEKIGRLEDKLKHYEPKL